MIWPVDGQGSAHLTRHRKNLSTAGFNHRLLKCKAPAKYWPVEIAGTPSFTGFHLILMKLGA